MHHKGQKQTQDLVGIYNNKKWLIIEKTDNNYVA
jgi:hypothetical protein